jgi:hypothetical protein
MAQQINWSWVQSKMNLFGMLAANRAMEESVEHM